MADLTWVQQPLTRLLARTLRRVSQGVSLDNHRFAFTDLREMWMADDHHVVLTHHQDKKWQYWHLAPEGGSDWDLVSVHSSRKAAQEAARADLPPVERPGTYLLARATPTSRCIKVHITSSRGAQTLTEIFTGLGYDTTTEEVVGVL